jgi:hypothetical protein
MKIEKDRTIFLSWSYSRRSEDIAAVKGIEYIYFKLNQRIRFFQFPILCIKTLLFLSRKRPHTIFIQHPPIHALLPVLIYSLVSGSKYIIDSHITPGTTLVERPHHSFYVFLHRFYSTFASMTLFHSRMILERFKRWRCRCMVLENPVRPLEITSDYPVPRRPAVGMVSSLSVDEYLEEVIGAASELPDIQFFITAEKERVASLTATSNIHYTGFIKGIRYYEFLKAMDMMVVLTDREESALLGAYETVSAETPLIVSDTMTMRYYFPCGAVFVKNNRGSIKEGVLRALREKETLERDIMVLKEKKLRKQQENLSLIDAVLDE